MAVTPEEKERLAGARPVVPEAYEAYLKGLSHWHKIAPQHVDTALKYFHRALEKDPNYALAYVGVAMIWRIRAFWGAMPRDEALPKSRSALRRALELDDNLPEAHHLQASSKMLEEWDWAGAESEYLRAIELNPSYVDAHVFYSNFLTAMRRFEEAEAEMKRALELDPLNSFTQAAWGVGLLHMRRYDEAIAQLQSSLAMEPGQPVALHSLWIALHQLGRDEEAYDTASKLYAALGDQEVPAAMGRGYEEAGYAAAMRAAAETLASRASSAYVPPVRIALLYAQAGEKDLALDWLEAGYANHAQDLAYLQVWHWDAIHDDPRFEELLRRMSFPAN